MRCHLKLCVHLLVFPSFPDNMGNPPISLVDSSLQPIHQSLYQGQHRRRICDHGDGLVQDRRNSSVLAMELRLFCTNLSMCRIPPDTSISAHCCLRGLAWVRTLGLVVPEKYLRWHSISQEDISAVFLFFQDDAFDYVVCKIATICLGLNFVIVIIGLSAENMIQ